MMTNQPAIDCPFIVVIDSAEQHPFTFDGLLADSDRNYAPLIIPKLYRSLGRHPDSLGDYSLTTLDGPTGIGRCHVERKSMEDAHGTILGFNDGRRARFESELSNLGQIESAVVVVECSFADLIRFAPDYGQKTASQNEKILQRSIIAFIQDYGVNWMFFESRRLAEDFTFRFLWRYWEKNLKPRKVREKKEQGAK